MYDANIYLYICACMRYINLIRIDIALQYLDIIIGNFIFTADHVDTVRVQITRNTTTL